MTDTTPLDGVSTLHVRANLLYVHELSPDTDFFKHGGGIADRRIHPSSEKGQQINNLIAMTALGLAAFIHSENVARGWWNKYGTTEFNPDRNVGEMLMLVVTEVAEACEAALSGANDDKLPQFSGVSVELADGVIRVLDLAGRLCPNFGDEFALACLDDQTFKYADRNFMFGTTLIARAMERARKGKTIDQQLAEFCVWSFRMAHAMKANIVDALKAKHVFNGSRPDHKLENRFKEGGKQF